MIDKSKNSDQETHEPMAIKKRFKQKVKYISTKAHVSEKEVYDIVRDFFKETLKLDYEFTHDELIEEIGKTYLEHDFHKKMVTFIEKIGEMEYSRYDFTQEELKNCLAEMNNIIDSLIHTKHKKTFMIKLFEKIGIKVSMKKSNDKENLILTQLTEARRIATNDLLKAKKLYKDAMKTYNTLPASVQKNHYNFLMETFNIIKNTDAQADITED